MKQKILTTPEEVREWIENTPHHIARVVELKRTGRYMELVSRTQKVRIHSDIWKKCKIRTGDQFDTRMYRWDNEENGA